MEREEFLGILKDAGFTEVVTVKRDPGGTLERHEHAFEAKALILEGELRIKVQEIETLYQVGDVFHLAAHLPHSEQYGPDGVTYLVGRK